MTATATRRGAAAAAAALAALLVLAPSAPAKKRKIGVRPDGRHPIQRALDRARPGTTLRIHPGRYREAPVIDTRVKLLGVGRGRPVIDARCDARFAVEVDANGVTLKGLKVVGADGAPGTVPSEVDFSYVRSGVANDLVLKDTCNAEYGVNVYYSTGAIDIRDSRALGFADAGFYVGGISSTPAGPIRVRRSEAYGNNRGVIVEGSAGGEVRVEGNSLHDNNLVRPAPIAPDWPPTGLLVNGSHRVVIEENRVLDNGIYGLRLAGGSDGNVISRNEIVGNPIDVLDLGAGNCGSGNSSATGDPIAPC